MIFHRISGAGRPVVVLEAGLAATSISWSRVQQRIAEFTTVVSYDRPGLGRSDSNRNDGSARAAAEDLARMLEATGLSGPFILVGHSFGGLIVRVFEQLFPEKVAGLVLVDPVVRAEWRDMPENKRRMLARGVTLSRRGAFLARLGIVRVALKLLIGGSRWAPKLVAKASAGNGAGVAERLVGEVKKIPKEDWPEIADQWSRPRSFQTMALNLEQLPVSVLQLDEGRTLGALPVTVLSAGKTNPEHQADAGLTSRGRNPVAPNSGHWIQLDAPEAIVDAVAEMVRGI